MVRARLTAAAVALVAGGCRPDLDQRADVVGGARILAIRSTPAQAKGADPVELEALVADPSGSADAASSLRWAFCDARKPLAELGPVNPACMYDGSADLVAIGAGEAVSGRVPQAACRRFGPETPLSKPGEPAGRPVDPDVTGGYYQPIVVHWSGDTALGALRLDCGVAGASPEAAAEYASRYRANTNPEISSLEAIPSGEGAVEPLSSGADGPPVMALRPGQSVMLRVTWTDCQDASAACAGAERYAALDLATREIVERREAIRVSWFATAGTFESDHTGRDAEDLGTDSEDRFTAPMETGRVSVWVVIRDDRGGVGWRLLYADVAEHLD